MLGGCIKFCSCAVNGGKALCVSLRGTELKRCAPSEADEERASPGRNTWMLGSETL